MVMAQIDGFHTRVLAWLADAFAVGGKDGSIKDLTDPQTEAAACLAQMEGAQFLARAARDLSKFDAAAEGLLGRIYWLPSAIEVQAEDPLSQSDRGR